jgi:hypothetical protein
MSGSQQVQSVAAGQWYNSPAMSFTLLANHSYGIGLLYDKVNTNGFQVGQTFSSNFPPSYGGPSIVGNGLTMPFMAALADAGVCTSGDVGPCTSGTVTFDSAPDLLNIANSAQSMKSLQIFAVPEPAEWTMLVTGLLAIGFIAHRRKHHAG